MSVLYISSLTKMLFEMIFQVKFLITKVNSTLFVIVIQEKSFENLPWPLS